jgi:isopropylmalate/homocitrate/citramalate synthase
MNSHITTFCHTFDTGLMLSNPQRDAIKEGITSVPIPTKSQLLQVNIRCDSLRDGLQGTYLSPSEKSQIKFIRLQQRLGINAVTVGIYSSMRLKDLSTQDKRTLRILEYMENEHPQLDPVMVVRATEVDIEFLKLCLDKNPRTIALVFQGNSPLRRFVQAWGDSSDVLKNLSQRVRQARAAGARVMSFTEDGARTPNDDVKEYVLRMLESDVTWIGIADTVGDFKPVGAYYKVSLIKQFIHDAGKQNGIVYHAHNDSGTAVESSLAAIAAGAEWVDVVVNGVGERAGNTDQFQLLNAIVTLLRDYGAESERYDRSVFWRTAKLFEKITGVALPHHAPIVGERAFTTSSGVHADAQLKIERELYKHQLEGATKTELFEYRKRLETVYSSISPAEFKRRVDIRLSPMSGAANVILVLYYLGLITQKQMATLEKQHPVVVDFLTYAKQTGKELCDEEIKRRFNDENWRLMAENDQLK